MITYWGLFPGEEILALFLFILELTSQPQSVREFPTGINMQPNNGFKYLPWGCGVEELE